MLFQKGLDFISLCSASTPQLPLSLTYLLAPSHSSLFTSKGCELSTMEILLLPWLLAPSCLPALEFSLGHYLAKQCVFSSFNILFSPSSISPTPQSLCCFSPKPPKTGGILQACGRPVLPSVFLLLQGMEVEFVA